MNFWRALLASLLSLACTLAVSAFVTLQTINDTLLSRGEVKTWLIDSSTYERLLPDLLASDPTTQQQLAALGNDALQQASRTAFIQTFPTGFVQQSTEKIIDGTYDWLDSKASSVQFEIDATGYKEAFITNLATQIEPQLAALPRCTSLAQFNATSPRCLPPGVTAAQAAESVATDVSNQALIFSRPINTDNLNQFFAAAPEPPAPLATTTNLPQSISIMRQWLMWLPLIAIAAGVLMVLLSQRKLRAGKHLAGRLTFGLAITCAVGLLVAHFGQTIAPSDYLPAASIGLVKEIGEPILRQAAPAIGYKLAIISGILGSVTLAAWVTLLIIKKRRERAELLKPHEEIAPVVIQPAQQAPVTPKDKPDAPSNP